MFAMFGDAEVLLLPPGKLVRIDNGLGSRIAATVKTNIDLNFNILYILSQVVLLSTV